MDNDNALPQFGGDSSNCLWAFAGAELNERDLSVKLKGKPVDLDYKSVEVLLVLLRHAGEVVTKDELFETVWAGRVTVEGVLTNAISKLRKALGEDLIATQHRIGYRLTVPVARKLLSETASELHLNEGDPVPGREAWRLLRALGTGGQGEVWLAEQNKTREQRVFKFAIDAGRLSSLKREATLYRLLRDVLGERRDFARVLEWNFETTPFFLECEYGGLSLVDWAEQGAGVAAVSLDERLRLMAETAEAVAASHSAGVLHKDLKPGNVLIWRDDTGSEHARLTDFGSSRLLDAAQLDAAGITRLGFTITQLAGESTSGTPLYRAPELLNGQLPTVQSDVYSLGVMLYQLVVGDLKRPLSPGWEQDVTDPLLRADIAAAAHGKPSERMAAADELARRLRTLDARRIEAIEQSQLAQRAATAEALVQRNRTRRPWIATAFVALILGLAGSLYFFSNAVMARDQTQDQLVKSQAMLDFMRRDLLGTSLYGKGGSSSITLLDALKLSTTKIEDRFSTLPTVAASVYEAMGQGLANAGAVEDALAAFDRADELYQKQGAADDPTAILVALEAVEMLIRLQAFEKTTSRLEAIKARIDLTSGDKELLTALWTMSKGRHHGQRNEQTPAFDALQEAVRLIDRYERSGRTVPTDFRLKVRMSRSIYAELLSDKGRPAEALPILKNALVDCASQFSASSYHCHSSRFRLASAYLQPEIRDLNLAEKMCLELRRDAASLDPKAFILINIAEALAEIYHLRQQWDEAIAQREFAHSLYVELRGSDKLNSAITAASIADAALARGDLELAQTWIEKSLVMGQKTLKDNAARHVLLLTYAEVLSERGSTSKVSELLKEIDLQALQSTADAIPWQARLNIVKACQLPESNTDRVALLSAAKAALLPAATDYSVQMRLIKRCGLSG